MKLAPVTFSIVHSDAGSHVGPHCGRSNPTILLRSNFAHLLRVRRRSGSLVARWKVSRQTGQLVCRWSIEEQPADDHLWRALNSTRQYRYRRQQQRLHSRCHRPVTKRVSFRFVGPGRVRVSFSVKALRHE